MRLNDRLPERRLEAREQDAFEAVFVRDGALLEGSRSNLFAVIGGELRTYPECNYILAGITRRLVIRLARELAIPVREAPVYWNELDSIDELFFSGTTTEIMPIRRLDGRPIGGGRPGPITTKLIAAFREHTLRCLSSQSVRNTAMGSTRAARRAGG